MKKRTAEEVQELVYQCRVKIEDVLYQEGVRDEVNFRLSNAKRTNGFFRYNKIKREFSISLNKNMLELSTEQEIFETLLHELGHAVEFCKYGNSNHGQRWKAICRRIGLKNPTRTSRKTYHEHIQHKYDVICENCGLLGHRNRKSRGGYTHRTCGGKITFKQNY